MSSKNLWTIIICGKILSEKLQKHITCQEYWSQKKNSYTGASAFAPCNFPIGECDYSTGLCVCTPGVFGANCTVQCQSGRDTRTYKYAHTHAQAYTCMCECIWYVYTLQCYVCVFGTFVFVNLTRVFARPAFLAPYAHFGINWNINEDVFVHECICTYMYLYIYVNTYVYSYMDIYVCMNLYIYI